MFKPVSSRVNLPEMEERVLAFWKDRHIFEQSLAIRQNSPRYVFYEGPPTANGRPGIHHVLARAFKDLFPRYHTMKGEFVLRKAGWDCHGLPVELEIEKELNLSGKPAIEDYGIVAFNAKCRDSVFRYIEEWRKMTERIGYWIDLDDPYVTLSNEYIESVWWALRQMWDRNLLYQDYKVVPYCPRCGTALSSAEVALGYEETSDPSVYIKLEMLDKLAGEEHERVYLLVWTTTPWTLPSNVALAVHPAVKYVLVKQGRERLVLAEALLGKALEGPYEVVREVAPAELVGKHYRRLYDFVEPEKDAYRVVAADFVTTEEGTGIVHIAPAFGEDDLRLARQADLPVVQLVDLRGNFTEEVRYWKGMFVKDADPQIIANLRDRGLLHRAGSIMHTYPFCWRCESPLLYYAKTSWFVRMTAVKEGLLEGNEAINWYPGHIKRGRFGDFLENVVDWALSRDRYWGTPLPIWRCEACGKQHCVGSVDELKRMGPSFAAEGRALDLHRPFVDEVPLTCPECGGQMWRVPEVIDAWFDSGSMPFAQWHYPFENQERFRLQFPADFICEAIDQTRGWFYSLHAISTALFKQPCYRNVICLGLVLDENGMKMSKSRGNVVTPWQVLPVHGADALRWYLYSATPPGNERRFSVNLVGEVVRKFLMTLWNTYSFFVTYANIDNFQPGGRPAQATPEDALLDRWIRSELNSLVREVTRDLDEYDPTSASRRIEDFVDDLSNWYVRRSRRRFWKSESDADKLSAYQTLYACLTTLAQLLAPFTPFISEELYQNLVRTVEAGAPESIHLTDWPAADVSAIDEELNADMRLAMRLASLGRAARSRANIKVRQPLETLMVKLRSPQEREAALRLQGLIIDELNVKRLEIVDSESDLVRYEVRPKVNLLGPKYGRRLPAIRSALAQLDPAEVARRKRADEDVTVAVDGETVALLPEEIEVNTIEREGYAVAEEAGYVVGVSRQLTPELVREGLARELVHRIQGMRKSAGFDITDTIVTYYLAPEAVSEVIRDFADYVKQETLSRELIEGQPSDGYQETQRIDGSEVKLTVVRRP